MEDEIGLKQQTVFQYSAKVEVNAKGYVQPHIHIYSNDRIAMIQETVDSLRLLVHGLKATGFQVATDLAKPEGNKSHTNDNIGIGSKMDNGH